MGSERHLQFGETVVTRFAHHQGYIFEQFLDPPSGVYQLAIGTLVAELVRAPPTKTNVIVTWSRKYWDAKLPILLMCAEVFSGAPPGDLVFCSLFLVHILSLVLLEQIDIKGCGCWVF